MYKRKSDGMWCQKIRKGDRYVVVYGKTQRELKEKISFEKPKSIPFGGVVQEWWEVHSREIESQRAYKAAMNAAISDLGEKSIDALRPVDFSRWINEVTARKNLSASSAANYRCVVQLVCRYAVSKGYIDYNPAAEIKLPAGLTRGRRQLPPSEDIQKILNSPDQPMKLFAVIALYTGLRRGEILALRKEDIDLEERTIIVNKALKMGNFRIVKDPKTEAGKRVVGIPDNLLPYLKDLPDGWIFQRNGLVYTEPQYIVAWRRYQRETGITTTAHQLRHAYTTALIEMGLPPEEVMRLVGHSNIQVTMNTYTHLRQQRAKQLAKKTLSLNYVP